LPHDIEKKIADQDHVSGLSILCKKSLSDLQIP